MDDACGNGPQFIGKTGEVGFGFDGGKALPVYGLRVAQIVKHNPALCAWFRRCYLPVFSTVLWEWS